MRVLLTLVIVGFVLAPVDAITPKFHHLLIRVGPQNPDAMRDYYFALFQPAGVRKETVGTAAGLASGDAYMLFTSQPDLRSGAFALWHFGWGNLVLNEPYATHYVREIEWKDPRVSLIDRFHLHLNSADPHAAAKWYAAAFGAELVLGDGDQSSSGAEDNDRRAAAFVKLGDVTLAFYRTSDRLVCSIGQRVDHIGIVADIATLERAPRISQLCGSLETGREFPSASVIEGPDGLAIEALSAPRTMPGREP